MLNGIIKKMRDWQETESLARTLHALNERELADMGLTKGDIDSVLEGSYRDIAGGRTDLSRDEQGQAGRALVKTLAAPHFRLFRA